LNEQRRGLLRWLSDEAWGVRNLEGIGEANDPENRARIMRLAGAVGIALGMIAVVASLANFVLGIEIPGYEIGSVALIAGAGSLLASLIFPLATKLPLWFVHVGALLVNVALFFAAYEAGDVFVFALVSYIGVGTVLAMMFRIGPLIAHLAVIGAAIALIMVRNGALGRADVAGWIVLMGVMAVSAGAAAWLVGRVRVLARLEHKARQDVERARAELEVVSGHKSAFLANMSHELRTPLNAIIGFSDVLEEGMAGELSGRQREYIADIRSSGRHLLALINDVLDIAKVEAGQYELEVGRFSLGDVLGSWIRVVKDRADGNGITLALSVADDLGEIEADERKVRQVVFNLLSNAVKFTPTGGRIDVIVRRIDKLVEVTVRDNGSGIAIEDQSRIFEEFARAKTPGVDDQEGTGLGLPLAKRFVELHGGHMWVSSALGEGSTFGFTLPRRFPGS
jgi:signal transduction histidine kinase